METNYGCFIRTQMGRNGLGCPTKTVLSSTPHVYFPWSICREQSQSSSDIILVVQTSWSPLFSPYEIALYFPDHPSSLFLALTPHGINLSRLHRPKPHTFLWIQLHPDHIQQQYYFQVHWKHLVSLFSASWLHFLWWCHAGESQNSQVTQTDINLSSSFMFPCHSFWLVMPVP